MAVWKLNFVLCCSLSFISLSSGVAVRRAVVPAYSLGNATWPYQTFRTANFTPPVVTITGHTNASEGYYFIAPDGATEFEMAPLIMDVDGELVWNGPREHGFNFGVQTYKGEPVLVGWNGTVFPDPYGRGNGVVRIWNKHYEEIAVVALPGQFQVNEPGRMLPSNVDVHEIFITPNGTMLVTANNVTRADLTSVGGPAHGWATDSQFYEIDISTNRILFSWKSMEHLDVLPVSASLHPLGAEGFDGISQRTSWEYFHINSVAPYDGGFIISSRFFCSAIAIDRSGRVRWQLQGRDGGDFTLGDDADFCYQHHVRAVPAFPAHGNNTHITITMHDNANIPTDRGKTPSAGKILDVNLVTKQVALKQLFINATGPVYSTAQGSLQPLANGNVFIGHGIVPVSEEFSCTGDILSTIQFGAAEVMAKGGFRTAELPTLNYRSFRQHWVGCPNTKPAIYVESDDVSATIFVSWNGATEVQSWAIFAGEEIVSFVKTVPKAGFETAVEVWNLERVQVRPVFKVGATHDCAQHVKSDLVQVRAGVADDL